MWIGHSDAELNNGCHDGRSARPRGCLTLDDHAGSEGGQAPVPQNSKGWPPNVRAEALSHLAFSEAAPPRLRDGRNLPPDVRAAAARLWDELAPIVYDALGEMPKRKHVRKPTLLSIFSRIRGRLPRYIEFIVAAAVYSPAPTSSRSWLNAPTAGLVSGGYTLVEEWAEYSTLGAASAQVIIGAIVWEILEMYFLASVRVRQYRRAQRSPEADTVLLDLQAALGARAAITRSRDEAVRLAVEHIGKRLSQQGVKVLAPLVGPVWGGASTLLAVYQLERLQLASQTAEELRIAHERLDEGKEPWPTENDAALFFEEQSVGNPALGQSEPGEH